MVAHEGTLLSANVVTSVLLPRTTFTFVAVDHVFVASARVALFQRHRGVEEGLGVGDDLVAGTVLYERPFSAPSASGDHVGAVERVVERAPPRVAALSANRALRDGDDQLRACGLRNLGCRHPCADLEVPPVG